MLPTICAVRRTVFGIPAIKESSLCTVPKRNTRETSDVIESRRCAYDANSTGKLRAVLLDPPRREKAIPPAPGLLANIDPIVREFGCAKPE
jgi:hypothetical protein